jgi:hypothetical protein
LADFFVAFFVALFASLLIAGLPATAGFALAGVVDTVFGAGAGAGLAGATAGFVACAAMNAFTCGYTWVRQRRPLKMP